MSKIYKLLSYDHVLEYPDKKIKLNIIVKCTTRGLHYKNYKFARKDNIVN